MKPQSTTEIREVLDQTIATQGRAVILYLSALRTIIPYEIKDGLLYAFDETGHEGAQDGGRHRKFRVEFIRQALQVDNARFQYEERQEGY